ncbi:unnamed protein product [Miscanthus lutarioriparius]|uniref:Uncharacterized protein n=1 Tax=Miscanthus lutarioriparius TaxID=422564 RepID=A0A811SFS2_9POAL|nr:unnamed protein product [Miscanthus lutarioriparius]
MTEMVVAARAPAPAAGRWGAAPPQELLERLKDYGQEGAFAFWDELAPEERDHLIRDIESLDLPRIDRIIRCSLRSQGAPVPTFEPVPESSVSTVGDRTPEDKERWWRRGLRAISEGSWPLFCWLVARGLGLAVLTLRDVSVSGFHLGSHFSNYKLNGFCVFRSWLLNALTPQVTFFQQGTIPCVSHDGRFIMETPYKVAKAPDGNGGVYAALKSKRLLDDMAAKGVKYVDCYGVDNVLVRVADPTFLGYFIDRGASAAAKVVRKAYPQEKVGVFVQRGKGGPLSVVEYSEMDAAMTTEINQTTGRLRYCWSNVCLHMFTLDFLNQVTNSLEKDSIYHLAEKRIPSVHGYTSGLKLEQFIFDVFNYSPSTALFESLFTPKFTGFLREEEFAPVKNANGGFLTHSVPLYMTGVEVSPLCSYAGENLEAICRGRTFHAPSEISF